MLPPPIQVKVTAFGMVCERRRTTDAPAVADLSAIISFLPDNMSSQSPLFRQQIQACLKQVSCQYVHEVLHMHVNVYECTVYVFVQCVCICV